MSKVDELFSVKEDLDKLIVTERTESIVPLIFVLCFLMAYYGPNAEHFGNIKLSLWHYEAIFPIQVNTFGIFAFWEQWIL